MLSYEMLVLEVDLLGFPEGEHNVLGGLLDIHRDTNRCAQMSDRDLPGKSCELLIYTVGTGLLGRPMKQLRMAG